MEMSGLIDRMRFRRDHRWAPERMSDYVEGELAAGARARIEHHLGECAECRRLLAGLRRTLDALHRLSPPSGGVAPAVLAAFVRARLDEPG
jgi:anti-sigma factor RsiW